MYESYWQLRQKPFENSADGEFYYPGESHQAALLKVRYAIESRRSGALLAGASGLGKTMLVGMLRATLGETFAPLAHLVFPEMPADQFMAYLAGQLLGSAQAGSLTEPRISGLADSVERIQAFLTSNAAQGRHAVVVIDEAHLLENYHTLETVRLLANFELAGSPCMTVLLAAQPQLLPILDRMPQLDERLAVKCLLRPFNPRETAQYVAHRLKAAGASQPLFDAEALDALHQLTHGVPRKINRLCDLALLVGYAEQQKRITARQIEAVSEELVAVVPE